MMNAAGLTYKFDSEKAVVSDGKTVSAHFTKSAGLFSTASDALLAMHAYKLEHNISQEILKAVPWFYAGPVSARASTS